MKKFGKFLLATAAIGTAVAAAYYFKHQNDLKTALADDEEDEDIFEDDLDECCERSYVSLNNTEEVDDFAVEEASEFSPLSEQLTAEEEVEEFFDDAK